MGKASATNSGSAVKWSLRFDHRHISSDTQEAAEQNRAEIRSSPAKGCGYARWSRADETSVTMIPLTTARAALARAWVAGSSQRAAPKESSVTTSALASTLLGFDTPGIQKPGHQGGGKQLPQLSIDRGSSGQILEHRHTSPAIRRALTAQHQCRAVASSSRAWRKCRHDEMAIELGFQDSRIVAPGCGEVGGVQQFVRSPPKKPKLRPDLRTTLENSRHLLERFDSV
jgi:hypothetical protein